MIEIRKFILLLLLSSSLISSFTFAHNADTASSPESSKITSSPHSSPSPNSSPSPTASPSPHISQSPAASPEALNMDSPGGLPLLFPILHPLPAANPVIKKVCDATDHPSECMASIAPFHSGESDPISILKMEMQALREGFKKATVKATQLNEDPAISNQVKECLDTCLETYDTGLFDLDDALEAIAAHDTPKLRAVLSVTISDIQTCEEAFIEKDNEEESPMKALDEELKKLATNNLAIATSLLH